MSFDFTTIMDRRGRDAIAVDAPLANHTPGGFAPTCPKEGFDLIPMWVADMNFATAPAITETISRRLAHPAFGYFDYSDAYYNAIIGWQTQRNGVSGLTRDCIGYENGVLGGVISALRVLCAQGGKVLLHSPTYIGFTHTLTGNGYRIVHSPLCRDAAGVWRMDFEDMEQKLASQQIHAAILCSPFNPCGRVWERWELELAMELFRKYDVYVISDEIWSDLTLSGQQHIPTQSVSEDARNRTIALYAPSKTFNLAGLIGSYHIIYNPYLRDRVREASALAHYNSMNVLSMHALIGAYSPDGAQWLEALRAVLTQNVDYACDYIAAHFAGVEVYRPQGTYMLFLDCTQWCRTHGKSIDELEQAAWDVGVAWQDGRMFHGPCHVRMNLALPLSRVQEAMQRLDRYVFNAR